MASVAKKNREAVEMLQAAQRNVKDPAKRREIESALKGTKAAQNKGDKVAQDAPKAAAKGQKVAPKAKTPQKATGKAEKASGKDRKQAAAVDPSKPETAYRENGSYHLVVKSLRMLGIGRFHDAAKVISKYVEICPADKLKAFKSKEARNEATHKDWKDRIAVNALVVERKDYGAPLREQAGHEVRHEKGEDGYRFGLFKIGK